MEKLIFEKSKKGRKGYTLPTLDEIGRAHV